MTDVAPTPARTSRRRAPRVVDQRPAAKLRAPKIDTARQARFFRDLLAARGVTPGKLLAAEGSLFTCAPCFEQGVAQLGWRLVRVEPSPAERGIVEELERTSWYFDRVEDRDEDEAEDDADDADEEGEDRPEAGLEARFYSERRHGLVRLERGEGEDLWLWTFPLGPSEKAWIATPSRAALRPLLTAVQRLDREHRRRTGLVLVGSYSEGSAKARGVTWDDLVLPAGLRDELRATVREFFAAAPLYRKHGIPHRRGVLLAGPPGNGKTSILHAIASDMDLPVVVATLDDPKNVHNTRNAFQRASELAPAVLCFEDIDSLVGEGPGLSQFLNGLDGLEPLEGVLVLATTNRPDRLDPAIAKRPSRFDRVFLIPEPALDQRRAYLARALGEDAPGDVLDRFAAETDGHSVAFLKELVLQARLAAIRRGDERPTPADLQAAVERTREHLRLASRGLEERGVGFGVEVD